MKKFTILILLFFASFASAQEVPPIKDAIPGRGYIPMTDAKRKEMQAKSHAAHGGRITMLAKNLTVPAAFDCRTNGWLIPTGDQGQCGSCYLYSTIWGTLTSSFIIAGYGKNDGSFVMSVQYGMDCHNFGGCNGGNGTEVIDWLCTNGWPAEKYIDLAGVTHNDYPPYQARSGSCRTVAGAKLWKPATWGFVNANGKPSTAEIKAAMLKYGPLNISLDAGGQFSNGTGTITTLGNNIDHEINMVGWDDAKGAFLLWNQWNTSWGTGGFRWCTYAAATHLVDIFFVSVDPLPPPPPVPPSVAPVVTSPLTLQVSLNVPFTYQITASNSPTSFSATGMPAGWTCSASGLISGVIAVVGSSATVQVSATNSSGIGTANLLVTTGVIPPIPVPGTTTFNVSKDIKAGTYELHKVGTQAAIDFLSGSGSAITTTKEPPTEDKNMLKMTEMLLGLQKVIELQQKQIEELRKQLYPEPKKTSMAPILKEDSYARFTRSEFEGWGSRSNRSGSGGTSASSRRELLLLCGEGDCSGASRQRKGHATAGVFSNEHEDAYKDRCDVYLSIRIHDADRIVSHLAGRYSCEPSRSSGGQQQSV